MGDPDKSKSTAKKPSKAQARLFCDPPAAKDKKIRAAPNDSNKPKLPALLKAKQQEYDSDSG